MGAASGSSGCAASPALQAWHAFHLLHEAVGHGNASYLECSPAYVAEAHWVFCISTHRLLWSQEQGASKQAQAQSRRQCATRVAQLSRKVGSQLGVLALGLPGRASQ